MTIVRVSNEFEDKKQAILYRLRHYRSMVANYQACKELYDQLFPSGTQTLTDMPRCQQDTFEPERWANRRYDLSVKMQTSLNEMALEISGLVDLMNSLESGQSAVLIRRYIFGESMEQVADTMRYSVRSCWDAHNRAIRRLVEREQQK